MNLVEEQRSDFLLQPQTGMASMNIREAVRRILLRLRVPVYLQSVKMFMSNGDIRNQDSRMCFVN